MWIFNGYFKYFKILEVNFKGINVLENQNLRRRIIKVFKNEFIGGCDIVKEMYENGELAKLFELYVKS